MGCGVATARAPQRVAGLKSHSTLVVFSFVVFILAVFSFVIFSFVVFSFAVFKPRHRFVLSPAQTNCVRMSRRQRREPASALESKLAGSLSFR